MIKLFFMTIENIDTIRSLYDELVKGEFAFNRVSARFLETITLTSILEDRKASRLTASEILKEDFPFVKRVFKGDNYVLVSLEIKDGSRRIGYISDLTMFNNKRKHVYSNE